MYSSEGGWGNLRKVPINTVGRETLSAITGSSALAIKMDTACLSATDTVMKYAIYTIHCLSATDTVMKYAIYTMHCLSATDTAI